MVKFRRSDCALRPLDRGDFDRVLRWRNSDHIRFNMYNTDVISEDTHQTWFDRACVDEHSKRFIFLYKDSPKGLVSISCIDKENDSAQWGFYLGESDGPKNLGRAMGFLALSFVFCDLRIKKLNSEIIFNNLKSLNYHLKLGFIKSTPFEDIITKNGKDIRILRLEILGQIWTKNSEFIKSDTFHDEDYE